MGRRAFQVVFKCSTHEIRYSQKKMTDAKADRSSDVYAQQRRRKRMKGLASKGEKERTVQLKDINRAESDLFFFFLV